MLDLDGPDPERLLESLMTFTTSPQRPLGDIIDIDIAHSSTPAVGAFQSHPRTQWNVEPLIGGLALLPQPQWRT